MSQRISRVNELLKREISSYIERNFEFPNTLVTVHDVDVVHDFRAAKVYIGVIGTDGQTQVVLDKLNHKHGAIQNAVMKRVVLRQTPHLSFTVDDSVERGVRIMNILDEIGEIDLPDDEDDDDLTKRL